MRTFDGWDVVPPAAAVDLNFSGSCVHVPPGYENGNRGPSTPMADTVGFRHHLPRLGLNISGHPRRSTGGTAFPAGRVAVLCRRDCALCLDARQGTPSPTRREWAAATFLAVLIFVGDYGLLFWAEKRVPSGIAAVMMATIPVFMAIAEILFLRTQKRSEERR